MSEAAQVPSTPAEAAQRCPQVRRPAWRRSLGCLFGILAWVARCGAAPRDRRLGPLGKGGAAALLLGLPLSRVLPGCRTRTPAALGLRPHQLPLGYAAASGLRQWSWSRSPDRASSGLSLRCLSPCHTPAEEQKLPRPLSGSAQHIVAPPRPTWPRPSIPFPRGPHPPRA